jgi:fumarate reductase iron-sulfur subunit
MRSKFEIKRYQNDNSFSETFEVAKRVSTLLEALFEIRENLDSSLAFESNCRSGVCGACAVIVDGKERLACNFRIEESKKYQISPLKYYKVQKDLIVDKKSIKDNTLKASKAFLNSYHEVILDSKDEAKNRIQSDCILCGSCFSSCPVLEVNSSFKGPFALSRAYRYLIDPRESSNKSIDAIQSSGVWDCTLCGECTAVCPQGIDPKSDILNLRAKSVQAGYQDPNFSSFDFGLSF